MPTRLLLLLVVAAACSLAAARQATASPISYSFSGTLNTPFNGSPQFSGTATFESAPKGTPENADITLNVGGQTIEFSSQDPDNGANAHWLSAGVSPSWNQLNPTGPREDEIIFFGYKSGSPSLGTPGTQFSMSSYALSSSENLADLTTLNFDPGISTVALNYHDSSGGEFYNGSGMITSFTPIETPTPEPSTWLIALLAGGAAALRLRRSA